LVLNGDTHRQCPNDPSYLLFFLNNTAEIATANIITEPAPMLKRDAHPTAITRHPLLEKFD
jgi:hypothetical protein